MRRLLAIAAAVGCIALAGCGKSFQDLQATLDVAGQATVSPQAVGVLNDTFAGVEATATVYLNQAKCPRGVSRPTCRDPAVTRTLDTAISEGRAARDKMLAFLEAHPGELGNQGLYDALRAAVGTMRSIFSAYGIGGSGR